MVCGFLVYFGEATYSFNSLQLLSIKSIDFCTALHDIRHVLKLQQTKSSINFAHLCIYPRSNNCDLIDKSKIFQMIYALFCFSIWTNNCSAFKCIEDFCRMETEYRQVTVIKHATTMALNPKGVRCIIYDAQVVVVCNFLDRLNIARISIAMHGHDGGGLGRNGSFDLGWVQVQCLGLHVYKNRFITMPQ